MALRQKSFKATYLSLFVATAAAMLGIGIIEPILPLYAHHMGATGFLLGLIFSGFAFSRGIFAPIIGRYSDNAGRRKMILIGLMCLTVLSVAYTWIASPWWLMLIRSLQGLASVLVTPIAQSYIGDLTPVGKEGRYMNLFFISFFGGQAIGPALGGYLSDLYNINMPFYAMSAMSFLALALVFFLVPESPNSRGQQKVRLKMRAAFQKVLGDSQMQAILTLMTSRGFYRWGFNTFFPVLALAEMSLSKTQVGVIVSFYMLAGALLQYPAGILSDRLIHWRKETMFYGSIFSPVMLFLIPTTNNFYFLIFLTLMMGVFSVVGRASAIAIRTERGRVHGMGVVTGTFTTSASLGQVLGPLSWGLIADFFPLKIAFYFGGVIGLLGSIGSYVLLMRSESTQEVIETSP